MQAYKAVWDRCLERIQTILRRLQAPIVEEVVHKVANAYTEVLPGLPYPELPVIAVHGANPSLVGDIASRLECVSSVVEGTSDAGLAVQVCKALQVHLYPAECASVANVMKGIVTGFVDRSSASRRTTASLAGFDINLLCAWYTTQSSHLGLVVFLHEFEKFDVKVVQDVMHVPRLPLVFVLLMGSPPVPSYLHTVYPRSTLALLRVHFVVASSGIVMVKEVLEKAFFDPDFDPDIMLGPAMMEYITEFSTRHMASPDVLLAHVKHFTHPLSTFALHQEGTEDACFVTEGELTSSHEFRPLVEALQVRLLAFTSPTSQSRAGSATPTTERRSSRPPQGDAGDVGSAQGLLARVSSGRAAFHRVGRRMRVAFQVARIAERVALGEVQANAKSAEGSGRLDNIEAFSGLLRGRAANQVRYVCMAVRKLPLARLRALLHRLHAFLWALQSAEVKREEEHARVWIVTHLNQLPPEREDGGSREEDSPAAQEAEVKEFASALGDWLQGYIEERFVRLDDQPFWDIWYTGNTPFPSELINPAPRPTVVSALLHPHDFARAHAELVRASSETAGEPETVLVSKHNLSHDPALWELPDTSIAFRRYMEAGRMVNVFDWFESFAVVLETQRKKLRRHTTANDSQRSPRPNGTHSTQGDRGSGRSNSRASARMEVDEEHAASEQDGHGDGENEDPEDEMDEEEERWKDEVQARFIRALHELDYMGFVKHTGRKPDHVIRTIYDIPD
ncbi:hypothetical protein BD414DRAFT_410622 [Trametes punicea]|nr:hypothetical protein BD414DRAFT_410622 [Trametes punicea]